VDEDPAIYRGVGDPSGTMTANTLIESTLLGGGGLGAGQRDRQLKNLVTVFALQIDLNRFGVDVDVFLDHFEKLTPQQGQVVRTTARATLLRDDDTQPLLCDAGRRGVTSKECK
jgi:hypothetical protein